MSKKDYYSILGLTQGASEQEIEKAYKSKARKLHPDRGGSQEQFKELQSAYSVLKDKDKRKMYDMGADPDAAGGFNQGGGFHGDFSGFQDFGGFDDIFSSFFGGSTRSTARASNVIKGQDIEFKVQISLLDAFNGMNISINYYKMSKCGSCYGDGLNKSQVSTCPQCRGRGVIDMLIFGFRQTCSACGGSGKVKQNCNDCKGQRIVKIKTSKTISIPAGVDHNQRLTFKTLGSDGINAPNGNLVVIVDIKSDPIFTRNGTTLIMTKEVNVSSMVFGGTVKVQTIDGQVIDAEIKSHSKVGDTVVLKGAGMTKYNSPSNRGELHINLIPVIPNSNNMSDAEHEAWNIIYKEQNKCTPPPKKRGFFF